MTVYVYDNDDASSMRAWKEMLGDYNFIEHLDGRLSRTPTDKDVLIVHRSSVGNLADLYKAAVKYCDMPIIVVSGKSQDSDNPPDDISNVYFRKAAVGDSDRQFKLCFRDFMVQYSTGRLDFSFLEPSYPANLVAAYLVGMAISRDPEAFVGQDLDPKLWIQATKEFGENINIENVAENLRRIESILGDIAKGKAK